METFDVGETIICSIEVKDNTGVLKDPATSTEIIITDPQGTIAVDSVAMTKDATGKYHYDYASSTTAITGTYTAKYTATDGTRITIEKERFSLE